ncbi:VWA domain-containing protein [Bacillus kwashiorkori]|uniref:VWA domain-containing protein n=1 Tax=Bacillus kwashiorkori TaxID=1522318 RepID=UPI0007824F21|nr:VWA domain-containing protein [Bacillus kwashiorkori]
MNVGTIKQILLITDGCSNHGEDPIAMATLAHEQGITINVIGVMENDVIDNQAMQEIESIAKQGGGISQIVYAQNLSQTVQMVTRQAMTQTLHGVINKELSQILGSAKTMNDLPPDKRGEIMEVVDELNETVNLEVLILVDTSASMKHKLPTVKEALLDLSLSLNARSGNNLFSVFIFPGKKKNVEKLLDWTPKLEALTSTFSKLTPGGLTPTGPAIQEAMSYFRKKRSLKGLLTRRDDEEYYEESV